MTLPYLETVLHALNLDTTQGRRTALTAGVISYSTYVITRYFIYRLYLHPVNRIPGPPVEWIPFTGNMRTIIREEAGVPFTWWTEKYGGIVGYHGPWNRPRVLITDPEILKEVLTTRHYDFIKSPDTSEFLIRFLGKGILVAEGETHRHQRKMLNPAFGVQTLRDMVPLMSVPAGQLRAQWFNELRPNEWTEIDISTGLSLATLDVIGIAGFGEQFRCVQNAGTPRANRLADAYMGIFSNDFSSMRVLTFFFPFLRHLPTPHNLQVKRYLQWLQEDSRQLVERGIEQYKKDPENMPNHLLGLMLREVDETTGQHMSVEELQNQCLTFLAAGHETTSVALSWCLWLLAQHQDIQDELRAEVRTVFDDTNMEHPMFTDPLHHSTDFRAEDAKLPSYEAINQLKLLNNVCKETMRLIPPVPTTSRMATKDMVLGAHVIPKGTFLVISPMVTHHLKSIWGEDAYEFRPSRWDEPAAASVSPYTYMPFYAGGRQCIGHRFATMEMKILLAFLIRDMRYTEIPGMQFKKKQQLTLRPVPSMQLRVSKV
ncbi:cytochrome P450 [Radiomyces spectabilis]|uniref:cytochrome P450 n=1 Tax=Radiomyces spectabilis TaxID=64574 RepID=UPI00221F4B83|nr:cytochrome P450 [Radiomyces spectabilis]KAI8369592.1 cytochrome P450 [Radiomyces spectabilis]